MKKYTFLVGLNTYFVMINTLQQQLDFISVSGAYDLATQAEAEAGTETTGKIFSPLRVKQAIDALAGSASVDGGTATSNYTGIPLIDGGSA